MERSVAEPKAEFVSRGDIFLAMFRAYYQKLVAKSANRQLASHGIEVTIIYQ
jgi:hypothetical protein